MKKVLIITCAVLVLLLAGCDKTGEEKSGATSNLASSVPDDIGNAAIFDSDNSDGGESTADEGESGAKSSLLFTIPDFEKYRRAKG